MSLDPDLRTAPPARAAAALLLALAFLVSAAVMVAELAAPRLVARHLGTSLFTWSATIATFLGGLALGNAWGGRLADRSGTRPLPGLLLGAGAALAASLPLDAALAGLLPASGLPPQARALVGLPLLFLPASVLLGATSPLLARALLAAGLPPGRGLGLLSAAGSAGAVAGVLLAGYVAIPSLGTRALLLGTAASLGALGAGAYGLGRLAGGGARATQAAAHVPPRPAEPPATPALRGLTALSFLAGATFLAMEMVAGRHAVLGLGSSLYTWTAVLAVVLLGAALGAWLGGRHADRRPPRRAVADVLAFGTLGAGVCLWTPMVMGRVLTPGLSWPLASLLSVAAAFFLPAAALGALSPALARAALADPASHGRTLGRMQAAGTLGAVVGAVGAAHLAIPLLGVPVLVMLITFALATATDRVAGTRTLLPVRGVLALLAVLALAPAGSPGGVGAALAGFGLRLGLREDGPGLYVKDSGYYRVRIEPEEGRWCLLAEPPDLEALERVPEARHRVVYEPARRRLHWQGPPMDAATLAALLPHLKGPGDDRALRSLAARSAHTVRQMALDKLTHGFADLQDPTWVGYDYEVVAAAVWRTAPRAGAGQEAFFVGGGPYTFQRRLLALDPGARLVTAEIDPAVTRAAQEHLGLEPDPRHEIAHEDARLVLPRLDAGRRFDVVFGDAFNDFSVPFHLTTREFAAQVRERLTPGGLYLVNVVDVWASGRFLGAFVRTLSQVFAHVEVLILGPRADQTRETFLLVASDVPPALGALADDLGRPLPVVRFGPADLLELRARTGELVLTDDFAPVEALLAPVARRAAEGP